MTGKIFIPCLIFLILFSTQAFAANPYRYRVINKNDYSYTGKSRIVYRIYIETDRPVNKIRLKATARSIWRHGNQKWDEFTVFMVYGEVKNFRFGACASAKFNPYGMEDFWVTDRPFLMIKIEHEPDMHKFNSKEADRRIGLIDPTSLQKGQVFFVSRRTPLMPYLESPKGVDGLATAFRSIKYLLPGGAFKIYEVSYRHGSGDPWYRVYGINPNGSHIGYGWINSMALMGQHLKEHKVK